MQGSLIAISLTLAVGACTVSTGSAPRGAAAVSGRQPPGVAQVAGAPRGQTAGPSGGFQTAVPPIDLNVILARPTSSAVTVSVFSATERDATITWEPGGGSLTRHLSSGRATAVEITGLSSDRAYRYQVTAAGASVQGQFRTARRPGSTFRFVMQADSHLDGNSDLRVYSNTLSNMIADAPDFLVDLGDTFMTEKYPTSQDAGAQYYAQRHYLGLTGRTIPLYLVQGNHDGELGWLPALAPQAAAMRSRYFASVTANDFYSTAATPRNYYAWRWGDATFIVLDPFVGTLTRPRRATSNWSWSLGREQYDWLQSVLQRTTTLFTFVFLHNLVGGHGSEARGGAEASQFWEWGGRNADGSPGFAGQRTGWAMPIHDLLMRHKVSAVFHGHDHLYVHQERDGIAYQEVPQPSFARQNATASAVQYGYASGTILGSSGHVRVTVSPTSAVVEYVRSRLTSGNGDVVDRYEIKPTAGRF